MDAEKSINYYFAPMEGITGYNYRNAHQTCYGGVDRYYTPFLTPNQHRRFAPKELKDVLPEHNEGLTVIPQILTNHADGFIWMANELGKMGYSEVNLNLGCPSGTVVAKNKGAGFLAKPEELDRFLDQIFSKTTVRISVKTRIGKESPQEFGRLMEIYNRYPLCELIIHPRLQTDYYKNKPNLLVFREAYSMSRSPVCYNGDLFTRAGYEQFISEFPKVNAVMFGRGLVANPGLACEIRNQTLLGKRQLLFKMKELWFYMIHMFGDAEKTSAGKYAKKIRKAERLADYEAAVLRLFEDLELEEGAGYNAGI